MTKTTYEAAFRFINAANAWIERQQAKARAIAREMNEPGWEFKTAPRTKLGYAIERIRPRVDKLIRQYNTALDDINIDHCETDEKGVILTGQRGEYLFKKSTKKARNQAQEQLNEEPVEVGPYYATHLPDDLTTAEAIAFEGFVIENADAYLNSQEGESLAVSA